jgi:hypothetical protein
MNRSAVNATIHTTIIAAINTAYIPADYSLWTTIVDAYTTFW